MSFFVLKEDAFSQLFWLWLASCIASFGFIYLEIMRILRKERIIMAVNFDLGNHYSIFLIKLNLFVPRFSWEAQRMPGKLLNISVKLLACHTATQSPTSAPRGGSLRGPEEEETAGVSGSKSAKPMFLTHYLYHLLVCVKSQPHKVFLRFLSTWINPTLMFVDFKWTACVFGTGKLCNMAFLYFWFIIWIIGFHGRWFQLSCICL